MTSTPRLPADLAPSRSRVLPGLIAAGIILGGFGLSGCSDQSPTARETTSASATPSATSSAGSSSDEVGAGVTVVSEGSLVPGDAVAEPDGKVVLTISGGAVTNGDGVLRLDLAQLESLRQIEYTVFDRQAEGKDVTFTGPLVRDVLALAGATGSTMHTVALNDYSVDVPVADAEELPLMLATRANGKPMTVAHYGPTRFIYPTEEYDLDQTVYDPRWIWQLKTIEVG